MSPWAGIIVLCTVPGILAAGIQIALLKKNDQHFAIGGIAVFYIGVFYGILSMAKMILDGEKLTLSESFTEIVSATYLHYLVPLVVLAVIIPCIASFVFRKINLLDLLPMSNSIAFGILAMGFIITGRISNAFYVIAMLTSILIALGVILFYKGEISYCAAKDIPLRISHTVPPTLLYVVTAILTLPGTLFLSNMSEFKIIPSSFAKAICTGAIVIFLIIAGAGALLLTWRQLELFYTILFAVTLAGYIQNMILNGYMMSMDGGAQTWPGIQLWGNTIIWIILGGGIVFLKFFLHKNVTKVYNAICIYLCLVQIVSLAYLAFMNIKDDDPAATHESWILSTNGALELHPDNNVLVFVLDWYDEQILEKVLAEDSDFLAPLDGFTYYPNATSLYAFTEMSIPYLLTGTEWQYDMEEEEYLEYAYSRSHMLDDILDAGYSIDLYTDQSYVSHSITNKLSNYTPYNLYCDTWDTVNLMLKCSKYQMAPFACKNKFWYTTSEITALTYDDGFIQWIVDNDLPFFNALENTKLSIKRSAPGTGNIKFYHMYGVHPPYIMTENFTVTDGGWLDYPSMLSQAKGSMKIVYEYIEQLKALDMYDSTTIIITADHGENYIYAPDRGGFLSALQLKYTSSPILLVKPANQTWEGIVQNSAPVSHTEVVASIVDAINPQATANYGNTLEDIRETEDRERIFTYYRSDLPYVRTSITGDALNSENWTIVETIPLD